MLISIRDNAIAKTHAMLKFTLLWAISMTIAVVVLTFACVYALYHRQVHWLPVCTEAEISIGGSAYSPNYLKQMTERAADLRLTYNPDTVDMRYTQLLRLIPVNQQDSFKRVLDAERTAVKSKNISSVFYAEKVSVDLKHNAGLIEGVLHRTSHGLQLKPKHKTYQLDFALHSGLLELQSIKEIHDAKN